MGFSDEEYKNKGAEFLNSSDEVYSKSDLICKVNLPAQEEINLLKQNTNLIVSNYNPDKEKNLIKKDLNVFALNLLPRITRAQSMDVLSSQANLAGYRAVIESIYEYEKSRSNDDDSSWYSSCSKSFSSWCWSSWITSQQPQPKG